MNRKMIVAGSLTLALGVGACMSVKDPTPAAFAADAPAAEMMQNRGQPVRLMTYNVENWQYSFMAFHVSKTTQPTWPEAALELIQRERREDDEENWEVARTILDVQPDIWLLQEGCSQPDLNYFNTQFLKGYFETIHVFKTNTDRNQNTAILMKPGFKVLEFREDYHAEPDTNDVNPESDRLFARGPGFALVQAPNGTKFWVGTNHAKSKSGNDVDVTKWRNGEAARTNQIINDLRNQGPRQVFFLGDLNDEIGMDQYEKQVGASAIELIAGTGANSLKLLTEPLVKRGEISFGGYRSARNRSFIDHAFATPEAAQWVKSVYVFRGDLADVASDHYPVVVDAVIR